MHNHMVGRAASVVSPFYPILLGHISMKTFRLFIVSSLQILMLRKQFLLLTYLKKRINSLYLINDSQQYPLMATYLSYQYWMLDNCVYLCFNL